MPERYLTPDDITNRLSSNRFGWNYSHKQNGEDHTWAFRTSLHTYWLNYHPERNDSPPILSASMFSDSGGNDLTDGYATIETLLSIYEDFLAIESINPTPVIRERSSIGLDIFKPAFN